MSERDGRPGRQLKPRAFRACVVLCIALALLLSGCAAKRTRIAKAQRQELLEATIKTYWHSLRWEYFDKAAPFVAEGEDQAAFWEYFLSRKDEANISEFTIYQINPDENMKSATAYISYQLLLKNQASVKDRRATQKWTHVDKKGWLLTITPEELSRLE